MKGWNRERHHILRIRHLIKHALSDIHMRYRYWWLRMMQVLESLGCEMGWVCRQAAGWIRAWPNLFAESLPPVVDDSREDLVSTCKTSSLLSKRDEGHSMINTIRSAFDTFPFSEFFTCSHYLIQEPILEAWKNTKFRSLSKPLAINTQNKCMTSAFPVHTELRPSAMASLSLKVTKPIQYPAFENVHWAKLLSLNK